MKIENNKKTARELVNDRKNSKIVSEWFDDGIKVCIVSLHSHFTAYFGIPESHPMANKSYDDIPASVHGGLTFGGKGSEKIFPKGFYFYGWDYAHCGDYTYFEGIGDRNHGEDHDWTLEEVEKEAKEAIDGFRKLMKLAESK